jgi:hypothetical protein
MIGVVQSHSVYGAGPSVVPGGVELRVPQVLHQLDLVLRHRAERVIAYFEDDDGSFYIDLETGSWRLVSPYDVSGASVDELRLTDSKGRFGDTTESGAELRGSFQIGGPGWVTFRDRSTDRPTLRCATVNEVAAVFCLVTVSI